MKILVVSQYYFPEQFRINDICKSLVKQGHEITVLTGLPNYPEGKVNREYKFLKQRRQCIDNVNIIRCFEIGRRKGIIFRILNYISFMFSASIKAMVLRKDFDLVYVYQLSPITMAVPAIIYKKTHRNKPIHLYCLDLWPESLLIENFKKESIIYKTVKIISKWIYNQCDYISVTSKGFINYFEKELNIKKDIIYLPQYAEECYDHNNNECSNNILENTDGILNLVFAGNIGKAQSIETIIKAANTLQDDNIKIHIIGDGSYLEKCKLLAKETKMQNIIFYGRKEMCEMPKYYNMADAMLITLSKNEIISRTMPGKLQSYMAFGKPIIGAIDGATQNIIKESKCGYCVEAENYQELANVIKKFKNDSIDDRRKMSENAYKYYKNNFRKQIFLNKLIDIFTKEV